MNTFNTARLTALALSLVLTAAMLTGIDSLASPGHGAPQMAQSSTATPQA